MLAKFGFLAALGVLASLGGLYLVQPQTPGGQGLLAVIIFGFVNGLGALVWRSK